MSPNDDDITWAIVLQHMQAMEQRILDKVEGVRTELKDDIGSVKSDLRRVESKVDLALLQIGNLDQRLDDIEVVQVPKLKKAVGMK